jgi:hypothetical protein
MDHARRLLHAVADRARGQAALAEARRRAAIRHNPDLWQRRGRHDGTTEGTPEPEDSDVLFRETSRDMIFSRGEDEPIIGYREVFEHLRRISLDPADTLAYLTDLVTQIS